MRRRLFLSLLTAAAAANADDRSDALDSVAPLATALANGEASEFLRHLPPGLPELSSLRENVSALIAQAQVTSSVEVLQVEKGSAELDWYMEIRSRATGNIVERRQGAVQIRFRKRDLLAIGPVSFFGPPRVQQ